MKDVLLLLTDSWADWEAAYAIAEINSTEAYRVKTIAEDSQPKASIGGVRAQVDCTLKEYTDFENTALIIMPGGFDWQRREHDAIAAFVTSARQEGVPIAAICGATVFLARHGLLDDVRHTGDEPEYFTGLSGYNGLDKYQPAQVVFDKGIITANETAAVEFAYAIFRLLTIDSPQELDDWYHKFHDGMFPAGA